MQDSSDLILYRRSLKNKLLIWKILSLVLLLSLCLYYVFDNNISQSSLIKKDYIARISIEGTIFEDDFRETKLQQIANDPKIKAVILHVNSPGGSVFGGESTYRALRKIAEKKPVTVVMRTIATSAGYMIAAAADHIVALESTTTGSIGALSISGDITELAKKIGVNLFVTKSGSLKAEPMPFTKPNVEVEEYTQQIVDDHFKMFLKIVKSRRKLTNANIDMISDGRVMTGAQALTINLIDMIGGEEESLKWLSEKKKISSSLKVADVSLKEKKSQDPFSILRSISFSTSVFDKYIKNIFFTDGKFMSL